MIKKALLVSLASSLLSLPFSLSAAEAQHGIKIGYASGSSAMISGQHLNLYNPFDPSTYKQEQVNAEGGEVSDMVTLGYSFRKPINSGPFSIDLGASLTNGLLAAQTITLVSQESAFNATSDQPDADFRILELYVGGIYRFASSSSYQPYVGAGLSLISGKAHKNFYKLEDLLTGNDTYGQSGSSNMDGTAISIKAGVQFDRIALELEHSQYDLHIDSFRSFEIDGADLSIDKTMLSLIFKIK